MGFKIGINGFGRIGRQVLRASLHRSDLEVVAINDLSDAATMAHLLAYDSVHGKLEAAITAHPDGIEINGRTVAITSVRDPEKLPWGDLGVDVVAECTGVFRDREAAAKHLGAGARKVIISAPAGNPDLTVVMGVNHSKYDPSQHHILSNASCTTNCLAPVAKVLMEHFGIQSGLMTTIHSYTGDQRLLDFPHKDLRRARAVALVLPELKDKLNGLAVRVPTPNVSLVDLVVTVEKEGVTVTDVNEALKTASQTTLEGILGYSELPLVSADFNGNTLSSIVDAATTYTVDRMVKVLAWYDNEAGYAARMVDLAALVGGQL